MIVLQSVESGVGFVREATRTYRRLDNPRPEWLEVNCSEGNTHVHLGSENYFIGAHGLLMPAKKNQMPPDLKWFRQLRD